MEIMLETRDLARTFRRPHQSSSPVVAPYLQSAALRNPMCIEGPPARLEPSASSNSVDTATFLDYDDL